MNAAHDIRPPYVVLGTSDDVDWHKRRTSGIGASDMPAILGESTYKSAYSVYLEKTGQCEPEDLSENEAVHWGNVLEPVVLEQYRQRTGRHAERSCQLLQSTVHPWALATLDGWTSDGPGRWPLEIKTVSAFCADDWVDGPPDDYLTQVHHQMLVTGAELATVACLIGGQKLVWCDVQRDEQRIRKIIYHGERFWKRVQDRNPPETDGSEATSKALARLHPNDSGETVVLPGEMIETVDQWRCLKEQKRELERKISELENELKAAIGGATTGALANGCSVSWKTQIAAERVVKASTFRVLRFHAAK